MNILIVRLGALGDIVHTIPAAAALRREARTVAPRVEHPDPDLRMDVLTLREALEGMSGTRVDAAR